MWWRRSRISPAALLVNVTARISHGATPDWIRCAMRCTSTRVLPVPAPARISSGPPAWYAAASCSGLSAADIGPRLTAPGAVSPLPRRGWRRDRRSAVPGTSACRRHVVAEPPKTQTARSPAPSLRTGCGQALRLAGLLALVAQLQSDLHVVVVLVLGEAADRVHRGHDLAPRHRILEVDEDDLLGLLLVDQRPQG